ncbi:Phospholipase D1 [Collimonas arenae]|uniref:Phospholipase D1 n=1 Tax=Collimonas arenae TaxID=279058 RepID=A0A0A1F7X5_9BURK|nr:phospholipase D-like domain-containing protein [Collimonas arenae]AIY39895.1 Phospholipase D1 [Collimonas arenae]
MDSYTAQLTAGTNTSITGQYFDLDQPFAFPRYGNECIRRTTGKDYFEAVAREIRAAKSFILITDWQLDYDVELDQRGVSGHPGRLSELLAAAMQRGVHVRVMLYDPITIAVDTHAQKSRKYLMELPQGTGSIEVMLQNPNTGRDILDRKNSNDFFSHHQKTLVIDGQIAFLGGMDLAYGRWDTNSFDVVIDPKMHVINDAYNQQLTPAHSLTPEEILLTNGNNKRPGFQASYGADGKVFDASFQPRQPWQDINLQIKGPAAFDVFVNFILRWNSFAGKDTNLLDRGMAVNWFKQAKGADYLCDPLQKGAGTAVVQICRSVSSQQLKDELSLWNNAHQYINDDWKQPDRTRRNAVQAARKAWVQDNQTSVLDAMINCIRSAQGFIYIENQFFVSDCGVDKFGTHSPAKNKIIAELANAIGKAIYAERPFHVWLVLPEHPEGMLEEAGTSSQLWWALQGVKRAQNSLIHRINATLVGFHLKEWKLEVQPKTNDEISMLLQQHGMQDKWREYLTVLNLRNYGSTEKSVLTEMVYIHSKLIIVDDAVAIIGSANINDRSLNGDGDTELAAVVVDTAEAGMTDVGNGIKIITRKFARELRMQQWKKHLGVLVDQSTTGVQKENHPPQSINIEHPLADATIKGIQNLAQENRAAYNEVFLHTPRNSFKTLTEGREKAYPLLFSGNGKHDFAAQPSLQPAYMSRTNTVTEHHVVDKAIDTLRAKVKGFWVEMPLDWGSEEKKTPKPPISPTVIASISSNSTLDTV